MNTYDHIQQEKPVAGGAPFLFGVFGNPVAHSLSPAMHNRAFEHTGVKAVYLPFCIEDIESGVAAARVLDIKGVSVTLPHKVSVIQWLDDLDPLAQRIHAVNTIVNRNGRLTGYNTDCYGALDALSQQVDIKDKTVAIIGAGGAARAVGYGIVENGGVLTVVNRSEDRGRQLAGDLSSAFLPLADAGDLVCDVLINTTRVGMHPDTAAMPIPAHVLKKGMTVMDIVYTPLATALLKQAQKNGCAVVDGLSMFVRQGARQFELWTGKKAPVGVMRREVREILASRGN